MGCDSGGLLPLALVRGLTQWLEFRISVRFPLGELALPFLLTLSFAFLASLGFGKTCGGVIQDARLRLRRFRATRVAFPVLSEPAGDFCAEGRRILPVPFRLSTFGGLTGRAGLGGLLLPAFAH